MNENLKKEAERYIHNMPSLPTSALKVMEEYFTTGLLHDIGKIPLNTIASDVYAVIMKTAEERQQSFIKMEDTLLGLNHCTCGNWIVDAWKLEGPVGDVIGHHHNCGAYGGPYRDFLYNVALANYFIQQGEIGSAGVPYPGLDPDTWKVLKVSPNIAQTLSETVTEAIRRAQIFLKI
jgi:hypothetical protein